MPSHKVQIQIYLLSGKSPGFVVVEIPDDEFLKLKVEFPEEGFKGHNPKLDVAIKNGITKVETERIARHLNLPYDTKLKLQTRGGIPRPVDEAKPAFESNGKKFWIFPQQS
jgi:hypothetical protein